MKPLPKFRYIQVKFDIDALVPTYQIGDVTIRLLLLGTARVWKEDGKCFFFPSNGIQLDRWQVNDIYKLLRYMTTQYFFNREKQA